ncbi:MAG TPA: TolC family protein [Nitrospiria bacterium]|nr:TolC family protein [Nitrospiria bacterium]HUK55160.1 TolC family protein [Nitrospiria bacterium]
MDRIRCRVYSLGLWMSLLIVSAPVSAGEPSAAAGRLALHEAVEIALSHHPSLLAARGALQAQQALVDVARSNFFPQLSLGSSYQRATANVNSSGNSAALGNTSLRGSSSGSLNESFNNYSATLTLQQRIFDFGKVGADVEAARENMQGSSWSEEASRQTVTVNVKVAYFGLLQARRLVQVQDETVQQFEQHLKQAEGFFQAGTRTRYDVTTAEVNLTNAQLNLINAQNAETVARVTLANTMGVPERPIGELEDLLSFQKFEISEDQAIQEALANRPELLSLSAQRQAAEASVRSAQRNYFPVLSGVADYSYGGEDFPLVRNWDAGVSLTFSIFSGYLMQSQIAQARANQVVIGANEEAFRQNIILEVHQAFSNLTEAEKRVQTSEIVVRQAEENLDLANGRFQAGVGTTVEQTDAQVLLTNAKTSQVQALYDYRVAEAQLQKAMGRKE